MLELKTQIKPKVHFLTNPMSLCQWYKSSVVTAAFELLPSLHFQKWPFNKNIIGASPPGKKVTPFDHFWLQL